MKWLFFKSDGTLKIIIITRKYAPSGKGSYLWGNICLLFSDSGICSSNSGECFRVLPKFCLYVMVGWGIMPVISKECSLGYYVNGQSKNFRMNFLWWKATF